MNDENYNEDNWHMDTGKRGLWCLWIIVSIVFMFACAVAGWMIFTI